MLDHTEGGSIVIQNATLLGNVLLQGRPSAPDPTWVNQIDVMMTAPGGTGPCSSAAVTTNQWGQFSIDDILTGQYDILVKGRRSLANARTVTLTSGSNSVNFGVLMEGDATEDNIVTILDFSVLSSSFNKCSGDPGYDDRADFNRSGCVTLADFSLLATNFGTQGDSLQQCEIPQMIRDQEAVSQGPTNTNELTPDQNNWPVIFALLPSTITVLAGSTFEVPVQIQAGPQYVDGVAAYLNFDPELLTVGHVSTAPSSSVFPIILENQFDNNAGTIDVALGLLPPTPYASGTITLAVVSLVAPEERVIGSSFSFSVALPRRTDAAFMGDSVFGGAIDTIVRTYVVDFDGDGQVTVNDLASIAVCWSRPIGGVCGEIYDLDYDGDIDITDVMTVAGHWGSSANSHGSKANSP